MVLPNDKEAFNGNILLFSRNFFYLRRRCEITIIKRKQSLWHPLPSMMVDLSKDITIDFSRMDSSMIKTLTTRSDFISGEVTIFNPAYKDVK